MIMKLDIYFISNTINIENDMEYEIERVSQRNSKKRILILTKLIRAIA